MNIFATFWRSFRGHAIAATLVCATSFGVAASAARAQDTVVTLDPSKTTVQFTLGGTVHTVHGSFKLKSGRIQFDLSTGKARGEIVVDARSGDSENSDRDKKMHQEVLKSDQFGEITFVPAQVHGALAQNGPSQIQVSGALRLLGQEHEVTWDFAVQRSAGSQVEVTTHFPVPYVQWGLKNPSNFLLHVDKSVNVEVRASAEMTPPPQR